MSGGGGGATLGGPGAYVGLGDVPGVAHALDPGMAATAAKQPMLLHATSMTFDMPAGMGGGVGGPAGVGGGSLLEHNYSGPTGSGMLMSPSRPEAPWGGLASSGGAVGSSLRTVSDLITNEHWTGPPQ